MRNGCQKGFGKRRLRCKMPSSSLIRRAALAFVACFVLGVVLFWKIPTREFPGMVANDCIVLDDGSVDCSGGGGDIGGEIPPCEFPEDDLGAPVFGATGDIPELKVTNTTSDTMVPATTSPSTTTGTAGSSAAGTNGSFLDFFSIFSGQAVGGQEAEKVKPCYVPPPACIPNKEKPAESCINCKNACEKCMCKSEKCRKPDDPPPEPGKEPSPECKEECKDQCDFTDCCDKMPDPQKCKDDRDKDNDECEDDESKCSCKQKYEKAVKACYGKDNAGKEYKSCNEKCTTPLGTDEECLRKCEDCVKKAAEDANKCAANLCKIDGGQNAVGGNNVGRPPIGGGMAPFGGLGGGFQGIGGAGGDIGGSGTPGSTGGTGTSGTGGAGSTGGTGTNGTNGAGGTNGTNGTIGGIGPVAPPPGGSSSSGGSSQSSMSSVSSSSSSTSSTPPGGSSSSQSSISTSSQSSSSSSTSSSGGGGSCVNCQYCNGDFCNQQLCDALGGGSGNYCIFDAGNRTCTPNPQRCGSSSSASFGFSSSTASSGRSSSTSSSIVIGCNQCAYCGIYVTCSRATCLALGPCVYNSETFECSPDPMFCASSSSAGSRGSSSSAASSTSSSGSSGSSGSSSSRSSSAFSSLSSFRSSSSVSSRSSSSSSYSSPRDGCTGLECMLGGGSYCAQSNRTCVLNFDNRPSCFDCMARNSSSSSSGFSDSSTPYSDIGGTVGGTIGGTIGGFVGGAEGGQAGTVGGGTIGGIGGIEGIPTGSFGSSSSRNLAFCGNGIVNTEYGEQCDMGNLNNDVLPDRCRTDCLVPRCGDRVLDSGEQCDDGALNGQLSVTTCDAQCRRSTYDAPPGTLATTIDLPLLPGQFINPLTGQVESSLTTIATSNPPAGQTGPAALAAMAAGASAGWAWLRRRRKP